MYKKSKILKALRAELEQGTALLVAQKRVGLKSCGTLFYWRQRPLIDRYVKACVGRCDRKRIQVVEDAHFKAAAEGNVRAQENILYNLAPHRWRKNRDELPRSGDVNVSVHVHPGRTTVFKDLGLDDGSDHPHAVQGAEGHRVADAIQSP